MTIEPTALASIIGNSGLPADQTDPILATFRPFVAEAGELMRESIKITVTSSDQLTEMQEARRMRLKFRDLRVKQEAARKVRKAQALKFGQTVDAASGWIENQIVLEEQRLQACEDFAKNAEAKRKGERAIQRSIALEKVGVGASAAGNYNLLEMSDDDFAALVETNRLAQVARAEQAAKAEEQRKANEAASAKEREQIRLENERLVAEAAESKRQLAEQQEAAADDQAIQSEIMGIQQQVMIATAGRAGVRRGGTLACIEETLAETVAWKIDPKRFGAMAATAKKAKDDAVKAIKALLADKKKSIAKAEAEAKEQADREAALKEQSVKAEAQAKKEHEAREKLEEAERERKRKAAAADAAEKKAALKAANAPDRAKILVFAEAIGNIDEPKLTTDAGKALMVEVMDRTAALVAFIEAEAARL